VAQTEASTPLVVGAVVVFLVALLAEVHHVLEERVAPLLGELLQAADRQGLSTSPLARGEGGMTWPLLAAGAAFALVVLLAAGFAWRAGRRRFTRRAALLALGALVWLAWDTLGFGGGLSLPVQLLQLAIPVAVLIALRQRPFWAAGLAGGFWVGLGFLTGGGFALLLVDDDLRRADHAQYAGQWTVLLVAWTWDHLRRTDGERDDLARWSGFASLGSLGLVTLSGFAAMVLPGEAWITAPGVHLVLAVLAVAATAAHVVVCVRQRKKARAGSRIERLGLVAAVLIGAVGLHHGGAAEAPVVVASSGSLDPAWLGSASSTIGCGASTGCHVVQAAAHARGGHAQAASGFYVDVVASLVDEGGDASLCARCHDPLAALDGTAGVPSDTSEGVSCGVCHAVVDAHPERADGSYELRGEPSFAAIGAWASTAYMLVKQDVAGHAAAWGPDALADGRACAGCHELALGGVALRSTWSEWEAGGSASSCSGCHAPVVGRAFGDGRPQLDHRFLSGNVGLSGLGPDEVSERVGFLSAAVTLRAERLEGTTVVSLENVGSGHGFPAAPLDLVVYGLDGRVGGVWVSLIPSIFGETLLDADGAPLARHEIWLAHGRRGAERLSPGRSRSWSLPRSDVDAVRLVHQRLRPELITAELAAGRMLDSVVLHEVTVDG